MSTSGREASNDGRETGRKNVTDRTQRIRPVTNVGRVDEGERTDLYVEYLVE